jgi:hypothetical protein
MSERQRILPDNEPPRKLVRHDARPSDTAGLTVADRTGADVEWLADQYELMLMALGSLGFGEKDGIPAYEQVCDAVSPDTAVWLNERQEAGDQDRLVIAPSLQAVGLVGSKQEPGLVRRYNRGQSDPFYRIWVWGQLWRQFGDKAAVHDNGVNELFSVAVLLGDKTDPQKPAQPANDLNEPGLVYTRLSSDGQKITLDAEIEQQARAGRQLMAATIGQLIVVSTADRETGLPALSRRGMTYLAHYPARPVPLGLFDYAPTFFSSHNYHLMLAMSEVPNKCDWSGVRRALLLPVEQPATQKTA